MLYSVTQRNFILPAIKTTNKGFLFLPGWTRAVRAGCYHRAGQQEEGKGKEEGEGYGWTQEGSGHGEYPEPTGPIQVPWMFVLLFLHESRLLGNERSADKWAVNVTAFWHVGRTHGVPPLSSGPTPPVLCPCRTITSWPWMSSVANTEQTSAMWVKKVFFFLVFSLWSLKRGFLSEPLHLSRSNISWLMFAINLFLSSQVCEVTLAR